MSRIRSGRRKYYDIFSRFYDMFVRLHARRDATDTRDFLVQEAAAHITSHPSVLDVCCGTGAVVLGFAARHTQSLMVGCDFSHGMLRKAKAKPCGEKTAFVEGNAASLPFLDDTFDVITCSHALYELRGEDRQAGLREMKRVVKPEGIVLLMEHEVPRNPFVRVLFDIRMMSMGAADAREFVRGGLEPFAVIFPRVSLARSPSGKSKLIACQK
jgi:ubiquinone/menaquinone biosynthesis C-methylase UbiE